MKKLIILSISLLFICINNLYSQEVTIDQEETVSSCVDTLYDSGGSLGNYSKNEDYTITISPANASKVSISFINSFDIGFNDDLYVYDGDNTGATQIYHKSNTTTKPADWTSSGPSVTIKFTSDGGPVSSVGFSMAWQGHTQVSGTTKTTDVTCNGNYDGEINLDVSGTTPISYEWTGPDLYSSTSQNINTLQAGKYYITATDYNGCFVADSFNINEPPALTLSLAKADVSCNGEDDGTITATAGGGTGPTYSYLWNTGSTNASISSLSPRAYTVTVTDDGATSCTIVDSATITEPSAIQEYTIQLTGDSYYCHGSSGVTVELNGSETGINYQLKKGVADIGVPLAGTGSKLYWYDVTEGTSYTVIATNPTTTCEKTMSGSIDITKNPALTLSLIKTDVTCNGEDDGTITATAGGGTGPYSYLWNTGSTNASISSLSPGAYTVTVTDDGATSCTIVNSATITEPSAIQEYTFKLTGESYYCSGSSGVTVELDGSEIGINYQLKDLVGDVGTPFAGTGSTLYWYDVTAGTYTVTATNPTTTCNKQMNGSIEITENSALTLSLIKTDVTCNGEDDGTITATAGGGTGPYSYLWNTGSTNASISSLSPGAYTVTVTDDGATSCTIVDSATITEPAAITMFNVTGTGEYCEGSTVIVGLDGSEIGVNYQLLIGGSDDGSPLAGTGSSLSWEDKIEGTYTVEATNTTTLCTQTMTDSAVVTENPLPTVTVTNLDSTYIYTDDPVVLIGNPSGGTFSGPGIIPSNNTFHPNSADTLSSNQILYSYTDGNGCTNVDTNMVDVVTSGGKINSLEAIYCYADQDFNIFGTNTNNKIGSFVISGGVGLHDNGDNSAYINPSLIGPGTDTITYTYTDGIEFNVVRTFTVDSVGYVDFDMNMQYCDGDDVVMLMPADTSQGVGFYPSGGNGTWSGAETPFFLTPDIIDGNTAQLDPNHAVFDSTYIINFYYTSPNGCKSNTATKSVTVHRKPNVSFTLLNYYNYEGEAVTLHGKVDGEVKPGIFTGPGITNDSIFNPYYAGIGDNKIINYEYTNPTTGCSNNVNDTTNIRAANETIPELNSTYCYQDTSFTISCSPIDFSDTIGTFTSYKNAITDVDPNDNKAVYSLVAAGDGVDTVTFTYYIGTTRFDVQKVVTIDSIGIIDFATLETSYCFGDPVISLKSDVYRPGTGNFSGYSGDGFINYGNSATIDPTIIPAGSYNIKYVFTSSVGEGICKDSISKPVTFYPIPDVSFSMRDIYNIEEDKDTLIASPSGGIFSGTGISGNYFLPEQAGVGSEFKITYTYTDIHSCSNSISDTTSVKQASGNIESTGDVYCYDDKSDVFVGKPENAIDVGFFIGDGINNIAPDTAQFNPAEAGSGNHNIRYQYKMKGDKDTAVFYLDKTITVDSIGFVDFTNLDNSYCHDAATTELTGIPKSSNGSFYGNGIVDRGDGSANFSPNDADIGENTIRYRYTNINTGCWVDVYKNVIINQVPDIDFTINDACIADSIRFTFASSLHIDSIMSASWTFGDGGTDNRFNPNHFYSSPGEYNINLTATTFAGCSNTKDSIINFGVPPVADFSWKNVCYGGDSVMFFNNTPGASNNYYWDFGDNDTSIHKNPKHSYNSIGDYDVKLIVTTDNSCNDTIVQKVHIRPYIKFDEHPSYTEDFNSGKNGWYSQYRDVSNSSWQFGIPQGNIINSNDADSVWCTNLTGNYNDNEKSNITSPCFDFTALNRPMIKMKVFSSSQEKYDGSVLQYSLDDSLWTNIGTIDDGIKWFNISGIASNPGDQKLYQEGWSGDNDSSWVEVRHDLDVISKENNVRFRIAFASDASNSDYEGFAFDNIWIGERSRKVLLEHFTNSSSTKCNTVSSQINPILEKNASDVVDIQYHTAYPGKDLFNSYNPAAPSARSIYYGVSGVPYSVLDGKLTYDYLSSSLSERSIKLRSLESPEFDIELQTEKNNNSIDVSATITALDTMNNKNVSLYITAVEKEIEIEGKSIKFKNVLRKMLPNSGGINFSKDWLPGSSETVSKSWQIDDEVNIDNLIIVAFVQDDNSKEIYQAATDDTTTSSTGITSFFANNNDFNFMLYPNPSVGETYVLFNKSLENDIYIQIFNQLGRVVKSVKIKKGNEMFVFNSSTYPEGMYYLRINDKKHSITKKIIVVK